MPSKHLEFRHQHNGTGKFYPRGSEKPERALVRCPDGELRIVRLDNAPWSAHAWKASYKHAGKRVEGDVKLDVDPKSDTFQELIFVPYGGQHPYRALYDYDERSKTLTLREPLPPFPSTAGTGRDFPPRAICA